MKTNTQEKYGCYWYGMDYTLAGRAVRMLTDLRITVMDRDEDTTSEHAMKLWAIRNYIVQNYRSIKVCDNSLRFGKRVMLPDYIGKPEFKNEIEKQKIRWGHAHDFKG